MHEAARPAGIDDEASPERESFSAARTTQRLHCAVALDGGDFHLVHVIDAGSDRFPNQGEVEVGPVPMRIHNLVVRARRHEQLPPVRLVVRKPFVAAMEAEGEAALQAGGDVRPRALPRAPLRE